MILWKWQSHRSSIIKRAISYYTIRKTECHHANKYPKGRRLPSGTGFHSVLEIEMRHGPHETDTG